MHLFVSLCDRIMKEKDKIYYEQISHLFMHYGKQYIAVAQSLIHNSDDAHDIVIDAFISLWEHRANVQPEHFVDYVFVTVKNQCVRYRKNLARQKDSLEELAKVERGFQDYISKAVELSNPSSVFTQEILDICDKEVGQLSETTRTVFYKKKFEDKSYKQISEETGLSTASIDYHLRLAMKTIRKALSDYGDYILIALIVTLSSLSGHL